MTRALLKYAEKLTLNLLVFAVEFAVGTAELLETRRNRKQQATP